MTLCSCQKSRDRVNELSRKIAQLSSQERQAKEKLREAESEKSRRKSIVDEKLEETRQQVATQREQFDEVRN